MRDWQPSIQRPAVGLIIAGYAAAAARLTFDSHAGPSFHQTAAEVIPVLALALVVERATLIETFRREHGLLDDLLTALVLALLAAGEWVAHANPNITAQVYAHLLSDSQLDAAAAVFDAPEATRTVRGTVRGRAPGSENRTGSGITDEKPSGS